MRLLNQWPGLCFMQVLTLRPGMPACHHTHMVHGQLRAQLDGLCPRLLGLESVMRGAVRISKLQKRADGVWPLL